MPSCRPSPRQWGPVAPRVKLTFLLPTLADPPAVTAILEAAGFAGVTFTDVNEPVYYGPDVAAALDWVRGFTCTNRVLKRLDPPSAARA